MTKQGLSLAAEFPAATEAEWRSLVEKTLKGRDFDKAMTSHTYDGIAVNGLYTEANARLSPRANGAGGEAALKVPHWNPNAKETNEAILEDLTGGAEGVMLRLSAGAFPGVDVSELGVALEDIHLNMASLTLIAGEEYQAASSALLALLDARNYSHDEVHGSLGIDPVGTLAQTGRLLETVETACKNAVQITRNVLNKGWNLTSFTADGGPYHMAGATEAQELGLALASGVYYLRAMEGAGLDLTEAAGKIQLSLTADADLYLTVAKFRAARLLWAQILKQSGCGDVCFNVDAISSLRMVSLKDPWVNILRATTACFGASVGGADSICILPHDTMLGISSAHARRIARNIQIVLKEESGTSNVTDPAAGAYAFETITSDLAAKAWEYFQKIEGEGGIVAALRSGVVHSDLEASWAGRRANIAKRKEALTGISEFPNIDEAPLKNIGAMPAQNSVLKDAGDTLPALPFHRSSEEFEKLRALSDEYVAKGKDRPSIFVANIGSAADFTARSSFAKNFFEAGGIKAVIGVGGEDEVALGQEFKQSGATIAVICSSDKQYEGYGTAVAAALSGAGAKHIYLAGKPPNTKGLVAAGVCTFIYMGCDVLVTLEQAYSAIETKLTGEKS
ncbi:MAG: methylmalonyl-CoA mutase [Kordiimonadales bacterium]|nr:MAG: methylmalonyl-CoA mutase [Kordiimonadales bacterium]